MVLAGILCLEMMNKMTDFTTVGDTELIKDLFEGVIDDKALAKLSTEELEAINRMLKEAGY